MDDGWVRLDSGSAQLSETAAVDLSVAHEGADTLSTKVAESRDGTPGQALRISVLREEVVVEIRSIQWGGVRVHTSVSREDTVAMERVPIGQVVDAVPAIREAGDTLIIPVVEEMLVVEKRLVVKEEPRIARHREATSEHTGHGSARSRSIRADRLTRCRTQSLR